jgi:tetratricopeptide (TPR) repeat protein
VAWVGFGLSMLVEANLYWSLFNLVPVVPLDGGRISQVLFTRVFGRKGLFASLGLGAAVSLVLAYLGMSKGFFFIGIFFGMFAAQAVGQILSVARASPVSESDPAAQALARATEAMRGQDLEGASKLAQAVLDKDPPAHPEVRSRAHHVLGWIAIKRGEGRLALDHFSQVQGQSVEPAALAAAFSLIGDDERSLPLWELAYKQTQDRTVLHEWAGALIRAGKVDRARAIPGVDLSSAYGCAERVFFLRERFSEAASAALKRVELKPTAEAAYDAACALSRAGDRERAVALLERAHTLGFEDLRHAATDPDLAALHGHPRFQAFLGGLKTATP